MKSLFESHTEFFDKMFSVDEMEMAHNEAERDMIKSCMCRKCGEGLKCLHDYYQKHGTPLCGLCAE